VIHISVFHTIQIIEAAGPFSESNMLDIERYHTLFKKLARGTNIMASIKNHYDILEACNQNRLIENMQWSSDALRSTPSGLVEKPDSAFKTDRCVAALGASTNGKLFPSNLLKVQDLWVIENKGYDPFRDRFVRFNRHRSPSVGATWCRRSPNGNHLGRMNSQRMKNSGRPCHPTSRSFTVSVCPCLQ
jgi:hypothetical protein